MDHIHEKIQYNHYLISYLDYISAIRIYNTHTSECRLAPNKAIHSIHGSTGEAPGNSVQRGIRQLVHGGNITESQVGVELWEEV